MSLRSIFHLASHFVYLHADYRYLFLLYTPTSLNVCSRCFTLFLLSTASMASQTIICCFWYFCILWYLSIVHQFFFLNVLNSGIYSSFVSLLMSNTQLALVLPWHPLLVFTTYFYHDLVYLVFTLPFRDVHVKLWISLYLEIVLPITKLWEHRMCFTEGLPQGLRCLRTDVTNLWSCVSVSVSTECFL